MTPENFELWVRPLTAEQVSDGQIQVRVPNAFALDWIERHYLGLISECASRVSDGISIELVLDAQGGGPQSQAAAQPNLRLLPGAPQESAWSSATQQDVPGASTGPGAPSKLHPALNHRYLFENFVVGPTNMFCHASCRAVADKPGHRYNPLFIYGGAGLGKTHLLHAIGQSVYATNPRARIRCISSEAFMNEVVNAIRYESITELRRNYRQECDLLLIDDIQFLAGKDRTQEEFFHIFNALHERSHQIVLTSDKMPHEIPNLEERLRSRFEWGLLADVQMPELETRIAILQKKALQRGVTLDDSVAFYIAKNVQSNIRELEGALVRLLAKSSFEQRPIDEEFAQEILGGQFRSEGSGLTADAIIKRVAARYSLKPSDIKGGQRRKTISQPRHVAMYLVKTMTSLSYPEVGEQFGGKDHSTVIYAVNKIEQELSRDPQLAAVINALEASLKK